MAGVVADLINTECEQTRKRAYLSRWASEAGRFRRLGAAEQHGVAEAHDGGEYPHSRIRPRESKF